VIVRRNPNTFAWAIAIPAHNEADRIGDCLAALARQRDVVLSDGVVVVLADNCSDDTAAIARNIRLGCVLHVIEQTSASGKGSAGEARHLAMAHARALVRADGILLTTDADAIADEDWIAAMLGCFVDDRIDLVAGRVSGNWDEMKHHPQAALNIGALECRYGELIVELEDAVDPQPHDPAPRHGQECGANIGIRVAMFDDVGGMPPIPVGEDRALIEAVLRCDGGVRHAWAPHVTASARIDGRAQGGMATALRERIEGTYRCDELVMPAALLERRLMLRKAARAAYSKGCFANWAAEIGVPAIAAEPHFGATWAQFMAHRPDLAASTLHPSELPGEIAKLERMLTQRIDYHVA